MLRYLYLFEPYASLRQPTPGKDAQWIANCSTCDDMELHVSRGGLRNDGITHCYGCGREKTTEGFKQDQIDRLVLSCKFHWQEYPIIPYNWHELTESQRWNVLGMAGNNE